MIVLDGPASIDSLLANMRAIARTATDKQLTGMLSEMVAVDQLRTLLPQWVDELPPDVSGGFDPEFWDGLKLTCSEDTDAKVMVAVVFLVRIWSARPNR